MADIGSTLSKYTSASELSNLLESDKAGIYFAKTYMALDGVTDDYDDLYALINTTINGADAEIWFKDGTCLIGTSIAIPTNVKLKCLNGGVLKPVSGVVITGSNAKIEAGLYQIFDLSLGGSIGGTWNVTKVYPEWFGATLTADDTVSIQNAINFVSQQSNSIYNTTYFGTVSLSRAVYNVTNLVMKSNVHIIGEGIAVTRINPVGSSGYVFDTVGTTRQSRLVQCDMKGFTISPKDRFSSTDYATRPDVGGINFTYCERINLKDIKINGIAGIGLNNLENFDSYMENLEFVYVGTDSNSPAMILDGTSYDGTNAIHVIGCRFEACSTMLRIKEGARQNQFIGCKFEWSDYGVATHSLAGIIVENSDQNTFVGCGFVAGDDVLPLIKVSATVNDVRGLKLTGCDFKASPTYHGLVFDVGLLALNINVTGCSFSGFEKIAIGIGSIQFNSNEVIDCGSPAIETSVGSVSNNTFQFMYGTDYVVKLTGSARCIGNTISSRTATTTKGISCVNESLVFGNNLSSLLEGIYVAGTGNVVRSNRNTATTPLNVNPTYVDYNLVEHYYGTAISPYADTSKYQVKVGTNFLALNIHNGTDFLNIPILNIGTIRPSSGKFVGAIFFDTSLNTGNGMLILWNGANWINASTGETV